MFCDQGLFLRKKTQSKLEVIICYIIAKFKRNIPLQGLLETGLKLPFHNIFLSPMAVLGVMYLTFNPITAIGLR